MVSAPPPLSWLLHSCTGHVTSWPTQSSSWFKTPTATESPSVTCLACYGGAHCAPTLAYISLCHSAGAGDCLEDFSHSAWVQNLCHSAGIFFPCLSASWVLFLTTFRGNRCKLIGIFSGPNSPLRCGFILLFLTFSLFFLFYFLVVVPVKRFTFNNCGIIFLQSGSGWCVFKPAGHLLMPSTVFL